MIGGEFGVLVEKRNGSSGFICLKSNCTRTITGATLYEPIEKITITVSSGAC